MKKQPKIGAGNIEGKQEEEAIKRGCKHKKTAKSVNKSEEEGNVRKKLIGIT